MNNEEIETTKHKLLRRYTYYFVHASSTVEPFIVMAKSAEDADISAMSMFARLNTQTNYIGIVHYMHTLDN